MLKLNKVTGENKATDSLKSIHLENSMQVHSKLHCGRLLIKTTRVGIFPVKVSLDGLITLTSTHDAANRNSSKPYGY